MHILLLHVRAGLAADAVHRVHGFQCVADGGLGEHQRAPFPGHAGNGWRLHGLSLHERVPLLGLHALHGDTFGTQFPDDVPHIAFFLVRNGG